MKDTRIQEVVEERARQSSLRDIFYAAFSNKWKMFFVFLGIFALIVVYTFAQDNVYRSDAMILLRTGPGMTGVDPITGEPYQEPQQLHLINSELEILRSRELVKNVVEVIGADTFIDAANGNYKPPKPEAEGSGADSSGGGDGETDGGQMGGVRMFLKSLVWTVHPKNWLSALGFVRKRSAQERAETDISGKLGSPGGQGQQQHQHCLRAHRSLLRALGCRGIHQAIPATTQPCIPISRGFAPNHRERHRANRAFLSRYRPRVS